MPLYLDFGRKHPHLQQTFLLTLLINLDVTSQDHLGFFKVVHWFFFTKSCGFLPMFTIRSPLLLDRLAKHKIICFTEIYSSCETLKILSKVPYVIFMGVSSNWTWWFLVLKGRNYFVVLIVIPHFKISLSQSHLTLFVGMLKLKLKIWNWKKTIYHLLFQGLLLKSYLLWYLNFYRFWI